MILAPVPGAARTWILGSGSVVYVRSNNSVVPLNPSATALWLLCDGVLTVDEIVSELATLFETHADDIRTEVNSAIAGFRSMGLLVGDDRASVDDQRVGLDASIARERAPLGAVVASGYRRLGPFAGLGSGFVVDVDDADLATFVADRFSDLRLGRDIVDTDHSVVMSHELDAENVRNWTVEIDGHGCGMGATDDSVLQELLTGLVFEIVSNRPVTFHAAAVEHADRTAIMTGSWGAGKTTTMLTLLRAGFGYLADETVAVDPVTLVAQPWPSPISQTSDGWKSLGVEPTVPPGCAPFVGWHQPLAASALGFARLSMPTRVGAIVMVEHSPGEATRIEVLDPAYLVSALQPMLLVPRGEREAWCDDLVTLARGIPGYRLTVDDLGAVPGLVAEVLERR